MPICKGCKQEIEWVKMPSGKRMPVDKKPTIVVVVEDGQGRAVEGYQPHWATCPNADEFRRKR